MKKITKSVLALTCVAASISSAHAFDSSKLVIWGAGDERGREAWERVGKVFEQDTGVKIVIENPDPISDKFQQAAATGDGPDLVFFAHDRFGEWGNSGLIAPLDIDSNIKSGIEDFAWDAVTVGGKVFGYPMFAEAVSLIYNKQLISTPPTSFEEILQGVAVDEGVEPIMWDYNNTYFSMPILAAKGGYAFNKDNGVYDPEDTGVNNQGAIAGAKVIKALIDNGMPAGVDYGIMDAEFAEGKVAMIINGPWSWSGYDEAEIDFGLAAIPSVGGSSSKPFVGVWSVAVNASSPNQDLAKLFMESYVMTDEVLLDMTRSGLNGALVFKTASAQQNDERIRTTLENAKAGTPMPNIPEMGAFWSAMGPALGNITSGRQTVEEALEVAEARILGE